jgi:hypothetical protein
MDLGSMPLKISRACIGTQQVGGEMSVNAMSMMAGTKANEFSNGRVLCLMNMITPAELMDGEEADGMCFLTACLETASITNQIDIQKSSKTSPKSVPSSVHCSTLRCPGLWAELARAVVLVRST